MTLLTVSVHEFCKPQQQTPIILIILLSGSFRMSARAGGQVSGVEEIIPLKPAFTQENTVVIREDRQTGAEEEEKEEGQLKR